MINEIRDIDETDLDRVVWRYLKFRKYISLITYYAIWFSKLNILEDELEGSIPKVTETKMRQEDQKWKKVFKDPEHQRQIDEWTSTNVKDGRELTVVNCWFLGESESAQMWREYSEPDSVAITSTIRNLREYVFCDPRTSKIGKVKYFDLSEEETCIYKAHQAQERAFYKSDKYKHEQELRIVTMNIKGLNCLSMNGDPLTSEECSGKNMNNAENAGLYVQADIGKIITSTILSPNSSEWFELLVRRIAQQSNIGNPVLKSKLENVFTI